jgi:hypothetical protein
MKSGHVGFLLSFGLGLLAAGPVTITAIAQDQKVTCQVYGGSFVLDDTDFKALGAKGITRENFATLDHRSGRLSAIAESCGG